MRSDELSIAGVLSIHAPRVGSDSAFLRPLSSVGHFNPRSPCGERHCPASGESKRKQFQSTLPVWGATNPCKDCIYYHKEFQSTLPVWGATGISSRRSARQEFQSTLPVWGATIGRQGAHSRTRISIHAPRVGSDLRSSLSSSRSRISIHAPRVGSDNPHRQ